METFIRKSLGLKAHTVVKVEAREAEGELVVQVERLGHRRLRCGVCGLEARRVAPTRRPARRWHDLAMRDHTVWLIYAPYRVWCPQCGLRVERIPWAAQWQRVTHALAGAVAALARELNWDAVAAHFRLNWKTVEAVVEGPRAPHYLDRSARGKLVPLWNLIVPTGLLEGEWEAAR